MHQSGAILLCKIYKAAKIRITAAVDLLLPMLRKIPPPGAAAAVGGSGTGL